MYIRELGISHFSLIPSSRYAQKIYCERSILCLTKKCKIYFIGVSQMRYLFKLTIFLVIFIGLLPKVIMAGKSAQYTGLVRKSHISPNGRLNAMIVEDKYPKGSEFSLQLVASAADGEFQLNSYSLTQRYDEFLLLPNGNIAFIAFNAATDYTVQVYNPQKIAIDSPLEYERIKIVQLQFSKDMQSFCYYSDFAAHPMASTKQKLSGMLNKKGWSIRHKGDFGYTESGGLVFSDVEKEAFTEWAPIVKPKELPQILSQPMPKINLETQIQWSFDNKYIYVLDETALWRLSPGSVYFPRWTQVVKNTNIARFEISPNGNTLLFETHRDTKTKTTSEDFLLDLGFDNYLYKMKDLYGLSRDIWLVDLTPINVDIPPYSQDELELAGGPIWPLDVTKQLSSRRIILGWGATFNPIGETIEVSTLAGHRVVNIKTLKSSERLPTGSIID